MSGEKTKEKLSIQQVDGNILLRKEDFLDEDILFDSRGNFELPSFDALDEQLETFFNSGTLNKTKKELNRQNYEEKELSLELEVDRNHSSASHFENSSGEFYAWKTNSAVENTNDKGDLTKPQKVFSNTKSTVSKSCVVEKNAPPLEAQSHVTLDSDTSRKKTIPLNHRNEMSDYGYYSKNSDPTGNSVFLENRPKTDERNELYYSDLYHPKRKREFIGEKLSSHSGISRETSNLRTSQTMKLERNSSLSDGTTMHSNLNNLKRQKWILPQDFEASSLQQPDRKLVEAQKDFFRQEFSSMPLKVSLQGSTSNVDVKAENSLPLQIVDSVLPVGHLSQTFKCNDVNKNDVKYLNESMQRQIDDTKRHSVNRSSILTSRLHRFPLKPKILFGVIELLHFLRKRNLPSDDPRYFILMKLLKAHTVPYPNSILTFRHLFALRVQYRIFYEMKRGGRLPEDTLNASRALTIGSGSIPQVEKMNNKSKPPERNFTRQQVFVQSLPFPAEKLSSDLNITPLDSSFLRKEADRLVTTLSRRFANKLATEISSFKCNEDASVEDSKRWGAQKRTLRIQYSKANLVVLQRKLRRRVLEERRMAEEQGKLGSKSRLRSFRALMKEAEKMERFMLKEMEAQEREKRKNFVSFLSSLMSHINNFRQYHKEYVHRLRRSVARSVLRYHEDKARAVERAEKEAERRRIIALKENDEEGYVNLLRQTKNERLLQVLNQTDEYLRHLGAVVKQQRDGTLNDGQRYLEKEETNKTDVLSRENCQTYYEIAHAIKEPITELPTILQGGTLKQYQIQGLQWLVSLYVNHLNGILADEMGLGKTIQAIALLAYLVEKKNNSGPFLIVVPLSTLSNWELEFEKWAPSLHVVVFKGDRKQRKSLYDTVIQPLNFNVCLTTFEFVSRGKNLLGKVEWNYLIVDEGHRMKNHESRITAILSQQFKSRSRLLMTGTPLQNSLSELWSLLNFVLPNIFSSSETFESWFAAPFASIPGEKADLSEEETLLIIRRLHQVLRPFLLRRLKSDVLRMGDQLPTKQEHVILCEISAWQKMVYRRILRGQKVVFTGLSGRRRHDFLSNPAMQLRKMANHPYLFYEDYSEELMLGNRDSEELFRASGKFYMFDMLLQKFLRTGHRVLVFNQMTRVIDLQERLLRFRGINFLRLDGSTKSEMRRNIVEEFNRSDTIYHVLLLTTRAGGLGVNLQSADTVIIFDSDWNPQMDLQAQDRAHRIGQDKEVLVLRIVAANTIEERILERASYKKDMEQKVIRAGMFNETSKDSDRQALLRELLKDDEERSSEGHESRVPDLETINAMISRSDNEMEIFQQVDEERQIELNSRSPLMEPNEIPSWVIGDVNEEDDEDLGEWSLSKSDYLPKESESSYSFHSVSSDDEISYQASEWEVHSAHRSKRDSYEFHQVSSEWCESNAKLRNAQSDNVSGTTCLLEPDETCNENVVGRDDRESDYSDSYQKSISERASISIEGLNGSLCFTDDETYSGWFEEAELGQET
ncbi:Transcription regulatory protein SNF2 [Galdieria sulphuraria]|nr:Transcription regulatory protein SNF2 [Galdieria sulphuraria]